MYTFVQDITDVNAYVHLLKTTSSLALCDLTMKNFVVQDFSIDNKQLKVSFTTSSPFTCACMLSRAEHTNLYHDVEIFLLENRIGYTGVVVMRWIHISRTVYHLRAM